MDVCVAHSHNLQFLYVPLLVLRYVEERVLVPTEEETCGDVLLVHRMKSNRANVTSMLSANQTTQKKSIFRKHNARD